MSSVIHSIHCRGYRGCYAGFDDDDCDCGATIKALQKENARLIDDIRYWSYCMSEGMRATCPEKVEELREFLISCKIAPYYMEKKEQPSDPRPTDRAGEARH